MVILFFTSLYQVAAYCADEFVFDNSEGGFSGDMFWPDFLQDCGKDSYMDNRAGDFQDIQSEIIFNFETGKITGSIQAQYQYESGVVKNDNTAQGTINGVIEKKNDHGYADGWYWEFIGEVDFSLHYHMEHLCQSDSGDYWESKDQILHVKGELSGRTREESWFFYLSWEDYETRDGRRRHVHFLPDSQSFDVVFPKPIELDVSITTPNEVNLNSDSTPFQLNVVGRDIDMVDHIEWSFSYWEPDLEQYWLLYHESSFETQGLDTLEVSDAMRDEWRYVANEYGFEADDGAEIDLQIALSVFDSEWNNLIEFVFFEYTYYTTIRTDDTSDTGSTSTEPSTTDPDPLPITDTSTSFFGGLRGALVAVSGVTLGGYGFFRFLRRKPSVVKPKPSVPRERTRDGSVKVIDDSIPEMKPSGYPVDSPELPEMKHPGGIVIDQPDLPEMKLADAHVPSEVSEMVIEDTQFSNEGGVDMKPGDFDGTVTTPSVSMGSDVTIEIPHSTKFQPDIEKIDIEELSKNSVPEPQGDLNVEGKTQPLESPDITKHEIKGDSRMTVGATVGSKDSLAVSSSSQIDGEKKEGSKPKEAVPNKETNSKKDVDKTSDPETKN